MWYDLPGDIDIGEDMTLNLDKSLFKKNLAYHGDGNMKIKGTYKQVIIISSKFKQVYTA